MKKIYGLLVAFALSLGFGGFESNVFAAVEGRLGEKEQEYIDKMQKYNKLYQRWLLVGEERLMDDEPHRPDPENYGLSKDYVVSGDDLQASLPRELFHAQQGEKRQVEVQQGALDLGKRLLSFEDWQKQIVDREPYMRTIEKKIMEYIYGEYLKFVGASVPVIAERSLRPELHQGATARSQGAMSIVVPFAPGGPGRETRREAAEVACPACTFSNKPGAAQCEICDAPLMAGRR